MRTHTENVGIHSLESVECSYNEQLQQYDHSCCQWYDGILNSDDCSEAQLKEMRHLSFGGLYNTESHTWLFKMKEQSASNSVVTRTMAFLDALSDSESNVLTQFVTIASSASA